VFRITTAGTPHRLKPTFEQARPEVLALADAGDQCSTGETDTCTHADMQVRVTELEGLVADLRDEIADYRRQDAVDASARVLDGLPDADLLKDEQASQFVLTLLHDFPGLVLLPYEATQLYEHFRDGNQAWRNWSLDDPFRAKIKMLGFERVMAEVDPLEGEWIQSYWEATAGDG
jgi:hypothetical protein